MLTYSYKMNLVFTYSLVEEMREAINMFLHPNDYKNLRSVVWPFPGKIINFSKRKSSSIKEIEKVWTKVSPEVERTWGKYHLKDLGNVTCFIHGISCEGWFDVDSNSIHVRLVNYDSEKELVDTIIHELLHLATFDKKLNYDEREAVVDSLLAKPEFKKLIT